MIERQIVNQNMREHLVKEYLAKELAKTGYSHTEIKRTPLGEKIVVYTTRPGLVVGRKGDNIKRLTLALKNKFKMENPQIELGEVPNPNLDASYIADRIISTLERFGSKRFKSIGYKTLQEVMDAGALGAEIVISGKVPSSRAKNWRFKAGYLKKSGDIAQYHVKKQTVQANLKSGTVGIKIAIMTPDILLPDKIEYTITAEEITEEEAKKEIKPKKKPKVKKVKKAKEKTKKDGDNKKK